MKLVQLCLTLTKLSKMFMLVCGLDNDYKNMRSLGVYKRTSVFQTSDQNYNLSLCHAKLHSIVFIFC